MFYLTERLVLAIFGYMELTTKEKAYIRAMNFMATFDGIITNEDDIKYMLDKGLERLVAKSRRHLVTITETAYPIRIKY